ncbi:MAG: type III pantothenate kinase [Candidatus Mcinerneyibacterium aminivorans]|uniref:Type III pantothenate kinase n=1 Tax=Candidatus Mcinerneyibacterium aminivorans TaxID=2703815 RepID=A0A5D0MGF2_9BACT|nr:MAG: type III pantothenate kinase [Candidatus Mcinerneyibacterium aminivorans]
MKDVNFDLNLAIDIGNSTVNIAFFENKDFINSISLQTDQMIKGNFKIEKPKDFNKQIAKVEKAGISSVVPEATNKVIDFIQEQKNIKIYKIEELDYNIKIDYEGLLGEDRMMAILGAFKDYGIKNVVVDIGSALTFSVLDKDKVFRGGMIALGPFNILRSSTQNTSQLENIKLHKPVANIGQNTESSLNSGIYWMIVGAIEKGIETIENEIGYKLGKILTGGGTDLVKDYFIEKNYILDRYLVVKGVNYLLLDNGV